MRIPACFLTTLLTSSLASAAFAAAPLSDAEIDAKARAIDARVLKIDAHTDVLLPGAPAITSGAAAQTVPASANAAKQAIENRKSVFTLIGTNFRPIGEILRGNLKPESVDVGKYTSRVAFLATFVDESFPEISRSGDTRAKPEIWSDHDAFEKRVKDFQEHTHALSQLATGTASNSDAFKAAARTVVQDCQGCHDSYRNK